MKRNFCKNILKFFMTVMLALCLLAIMGACQSKKQLRLNNYKKYISVEYYPAFESDNYNIIIVDYIIIEKVNEDDELSDVAIKCSYVINGYEGEFSENLIDLNSTYRKEILMPENWGEDSSHSGQVTVLEISGTVQRRIDFEKMAPTYGSVAFLLALFVILGLLVARGLKFLGNFDKIQIGMSYSKVIELLDEPDSSSEVDNILTCVWRIHVLRGWIIVRAVTFKDDTVISKTD